MWMRVERLRVCFVDVVYNPRRCSATTNALIVVIKKLAPSARRTQKPSRLRCLGYTIA